MKNQNGFTHWVIVILISIMAVGLVGAAWWWEHEQKELPSISVPVDVQLTVDQGSVVGEPTPFQVTFTPRDDFHRAAGVVSASGVVSIVESPSLIWEAPRNGDRLINQGIIQIDDYGEGELRFNVTVYDESDNSIFGRSSIMYFLATEEGIFTNSSSPMLLKKDYLQLLLVTMKITPLEYQKRLNQLLGGGAKEESEIIKESQ